MDNKKQEKKEEPKAQPQQQPKMREIRIETDGNTAKIIRADVAGGLELKAILQGLLQSIN